MSHLTYRLWEGWSLFATCGLQTQLPAPPSQVGKAATELF